MRILQTDRAAPLNPSALVRARMLRGLSQMELALRSGLSRTQLYKLERGEVQNPTVGTVHSLAQELKVPASYLATQPGPVPPEESLHCRAKINRPVRVVEELQVRGEHFRRLMMHLEGYIQAPAVHVPEHRASGAAAIELAAEACRVDWGLRVDNPIANMTRLLERAGAFVGLFHHDGGVVDAFSWWDGRPYILSKRNSESATRRRHSLAHELGHLVIHRSVATGDK